MGVLTNVAVAFTDINATLNSPTPHIEVGRFAQACCLISPLLSSLGIFKFAEMEFSAKVDDLMEASKSIDTLESLLDSDIKQRCERSSNSHSRNLVRVKRSIDLVRKMFEEILSRGGKSIVVPLSIAYKRVFAPYHGWAIRTAVTAAMISVPSKPQLLRKLNEDESTANVQMRNFVGASTSVISYIDNLFRSRAAGNDLLGMI